MGEINFSHIFYLTQYIQYSIISTVIDFKIINEQF